MSPQVRAPPAPTDDSYEALPDTQLVVSSPGVLANDEDRNAHTLLTIAGEPPARGTLDVFNPDGSFTYTPDPGMIGVDRFTYGVTDGTYETLTADRATAYIAVGWTVGVNATVKLQGVGDGADFGSMEPSLTFADGLGNPEIVRPFGPTAAGNVAASDVWPGVYTVTASAPGFLASVINRVIIGF